MTIDRAIGFLTAERNRANGEARNAFDEAIEALEEKLDREKASAETDISN